MSADPAILLDVSRLISRLGKGPLTGIDRVEAEWLAHLEGGGTPFLLLSRVARGQVVLPARMGAKILDWADGRTGDLPQPGLFNRLRGHRDCPARAEITLRAGALFSSGRGGRGVSRYVGSQLGEAVAYLNVGHSNLTRPLWQRLAPMTRVLLVHDTIPLDHPEFTRAGQARKFRERFSAALGQADLILTISQSSRADVLRWRDALKLPARAQVMTARIGTVLAKPAPAGLPAGLNLERPFFVTLGTIEPRKNHALLLDAWEELARRMPAARIPQLFIIGRRGWENRDVFARLDRLPKGGAVREVAGIDDGAVAELLERAHGLLMPSRAEGFGLPLTEAAARGVPVLCSPLPSARELLGDYAHYLSPDDHRAWAGAVSLLAGALPLRMPPLTVPQWSAHFAQVQAALREGLHPDLPKAMPG